MHDCQAIRCIRISRDKKELAGFSIERTCRLKYNGCPNLRPGLDKEDKTKVAIKQETSYCTPGLSNTLGI